MHALWLQHLKAREPMRHITVCMHGHIGHATLNQAVNGVSQAAQVYDL